MSAVDEFPLDTSAYLSDTGHLTTFEHGAYLLILMAMWRSPEGWLSNSDQYLSRASHMTGDKWKRIAPTIRALLKVDGDRISQKRLLKMKSRNPSQTPSLDSSRPVKPLKHKEPGPNSGTNQKIDPTVLTLTSTDSVDSKEKKEKKKGHPLPDGWVPRQHERLYGKSINLTDVQIDRAAEKMRRWAITNAHRAVARKTDWDMTFKNWLDGESSGKYSGQQSNGNPKQSWQVQQDDTEGYLKHLREVAVHGRNGNAQADRAAIPGPSVSRSGGDADPGPVASSLDPRSRDLH